MYRGTTPTIVFTITSGINVSDINLSATHITFECGTSELDFSNTNIATDTINNTLSVSLTQAQTLAWTEGQVNIQIRATLNNGKVVASNIMSTDLERILLEGVI